MLSAVVDSQEEICLAGYVTTSRFLGDLFVFWEPVNSVQGISGVCVPFTRFLNKLESDSELAYSSMCLIRVLGAFWRFLSVLNVCHSVFSPVSGVSTTVYFAYLLSNNDLTSVILTSLYC